MTGINGASGNVTGLIDTGADITQLPVGFASLMGYDASTLESIPIGTAGAVTQVLRAKKPCQGYVVGVPSVVMDFLPVFSASPYVLWGRTDFMAAFGVSVDERSQEFTIHW